LFSVQAGEADLELNRCYESGAGVAEIAQMQKFLHYICSNGFEHHIAANFSSVAGAVQEAATRYFGWEMYWHAN
jgi:L-fucose isomerase-like protein